MATIKEIKEQIENANALGRQNLTEKGVTIPENATTYEIMKNIKNVSGSSAELDALEDLIDNSEVLEDTEGSVTEKVEELIDKAKSGSSPSIDENGIVTFGGDTTIDENGILSL